MLSNEIISKLLSFIEINEARLLNWGFYNVSANVDEVGDLVVQNGPIDLQNELQDLENDGYGLEVILQEMVHAGLLHEVRHGRFRSRFGEGVRLIANLRQMFKESDWSSGPRLVSDIKLQINPRRYPKRDQTLADCWEDLSAVAGEIELQGAAFRVLSVNGKGDELRYARFQRSGFSRILSRYKAKGVTGSIVTAGTGSGKTKAFYIPAFMGVVTELNSSKRFTKILATYPRNVLLADQLREALSEAAKLEPVYQEFGLRRITFGALLGTTPERSWFESKDGTYYAVKRGWKRVGNGFVVPFLKSPGDSESSLIWRDSDRLRGSTALYRQGTTGSEPEIPDGVLVLTRDDLKSGPPDFLFLSIEMLNREMGNPDWERTFGFGSSEEAPRMLLLDEVHAYEGLSGAQVAWVLRRWRHWARTNSLHVVGLSATLKNAPGHLGTLVGIPSSTIEEFTPASQELTLQDAEYNLAIKGDPAAGASLLSTTIQTGMLLTRLLTPPHLPRINGRSLSGASFFGRKAFGFTDNLDSLNRWFSDMSDAEKKRLAALRSPPEQGSRSTVPASVIVAKDQSGQIWGLPSRIGHNLNQPLKVTRCSSQDPGLNAGSDLIVASASLEVGFDDPEVGAILHHKKPTSMSSFIQRKGRAGRRVGTRPWTVTVLSDYGADRWTFQNAERLFQPEIEQIRLPILNPYVLRIQAAYFLIDWLGHKIEKGSPYSYLAGKSPFDARPQVSKLLSGLLDLGPTWRQFKRDFVKLFRKPFGDSRNLFSESDIDDLLWYEPRPLLLEVVPSLLRRAENGWRYADPKLDGKYEDRTAGRPIPNFIPGATFNTIADTGTELVFPESDEKEPEPLPISRALNEACPGRVSKRYSLKVGEAGYWLAYSERLLNADEVVVASVKDLFEDRLLLGEVNGLPIFQPISIEVTHRPEGVIDTSNSFWNWESSFQIARSGSPTPINVGRPWQDLFEGAETHLHRDKSGIKVTRYSQECRYELRIGSPRKKSITKRGKLYLGSSSLDGTLQPEGLGFRVDADGIEIGLNQELINSVGDTDESRQARFRPQFLLSEMQRSETLNGQMNPFLIGWMWLVSLAMLSATALMQRCTLESAQSKLRGKRVESARRVLERIFQVRDVSSNDDEDSRLKQRILEQWENASVVERMEELESLLWIGLGQDYQEWVKSRFISTVAQAVRVASGYQIGEVGDEELIVDTFREADRTSVYITETSSGGIGQLETLASAIRRRPEKFSDALRFSTTFCRRELLDRNVIRALTKSLDTKGSTSLRGAFSDVRSAIGFQQMADAKAQLQLSLESEGLDSSRDIVVSLLARVLRPGSSRESDSYIYLLNKAWHKHEKRLGISIDPRTFAYICVQYPPLLRRLKDLFRSIGGGEEPSTGQIFALLQQLLFEGCIDSCPECLASRNRYDQLPQPSRELSSKILNFEEIVIKIDEPDSDWPGIIRAKLKEKFRIKLEFGASRLEEVVTRLQSLLAHEIEIEFQFLPIFISAIERVPEGWAVVLEIRGYQGGE